MKTDVHHVFDIDWEKDDCLLHSGVHPIIFLIVRLFRWIELPDAVYSGFTATNEK